jgi:hypothetical protein
MLPAAPFISIQVDVVMLALDVSRGRGCRKLLEQFARCNARRPTQIYSLAEMARNRSTQSPRF